VGIIDSDSEYIYAVQGYFSSNINSSIEVLGFSDISFLEEFIAKERLDMVLCGLEYYEKLKASRDILCQATALTLLCENTNQAEAGIYKYQTAEGLCQSINRRLFTDDKRETVTQRIAVFSPLGRCGKTTLARAVAFIDEVRGGLLISMENYAEHEVSCESLLMYQILNKAPDIEKLITRNIRTVRGVNVVEPVGIHFDAMGVNSDSLRYMMDQLLKSGRFSTICFDFGSCAVADFKLLCEFDYVLMPVLSDEVSERKLESFFNYIEKTGNGELIKRIRRLNVPIGEFDSPPVISVATRVIEEMNGRKFIREN